VVTKAGAKELIFEVIQNNPKEEVFTGYQQGYLRMR
jgi:hypothetical protein